MATVFHTGRNMLSVWLDGCKTFVDSMSTQCRLGVDSVDTHIDSPSKPPHIGSLSMLPYIDSVSMLTATRCSS